MMSFISLLALLLVSSASFAQTCPFKPTKRRVLILGLDGATGNQLHYRALVENKMPAIKSLMQEGKYAPCIDEKHPKSGGHKDPRCARAHSGPRAGEGFQWLTAPGWLSVLTGVDNKQHLVKDNEPINLMAYTQTRKKWPTFFTRARQKGLQTAAGGVACFMTSVGEKSKPGIVDYECGGDTNLKPMVAATATTSCNLTRRRADNNTSNSRDQNLASFLKTQIQDPTMDIVMGVFDGVDAAGHHSGFSSNDTYLAALSTVDEQIAPLLQEVRARATSAAEAWLVILTADHGGHSFIFFGLHDTRAGEDDAIPFIVATYGTCDKLRDLQYPVTHMDVHPTVMKWLGENSPYVDGKVQGLTN